MNSVDVLKEIYKPLKVTIQGKVKVFDTMQGKYVIKEKGNADIRKIFNYLTSRNFNYFPKIIDDTRSEVNVFEYVEEVETPKDQKAQDLINIVALLHSKTSYYKEVSEDKYKEIYEMIKSNVDYLDQHYNDLFDNFITLEFMSPSQYLFMRNFTTIKNALTFCNNELLNWYDLVKDKKKQRVALLHNNLELNHYIRGDNDYLISWENSMVDTPVWDIVKFYRKEFYNIEFSNLLSKYMNSYELLEDEKKLLFILMTLPDKIEFDNDELKVVNNVRLCLDYLYKTELLVRPYYTKQEKE